MLFAGEREDPEEKGEKSIDGGSCRACLLQCRVWGSAYSEEMCGWGKGEVRLTLGFSNIFSHSEGCTFTLFKASFAVKKLLNLIRFHLFIFAFISFTLEPDLKKHCYDLC